jgi:hypothetical protein
VRRDLSRCPGFFLKGKLWQQRQSGSKEDKGGNMPAKNTDQEMITNTLKSVSLKLQAETHFSLSSIIIFLFPYLIFMGTRSGASAG